MCPLLRCRGVKPTIATMAMSSTNSKVRRNKRKNLDSGDMVAKNGRRLTKISINEKIANKRSYSIVAMSPKVGQ